MKVRNFLLQNNGVKGAFPSISESSSPGRDNHERQVDPDRHQASVRNKDVIKIGTWNVRTLFQCGKLNNVKQEMERLGINLLAINETRWLNNGEIMLDGFKFIYAGGQKHEKGIGLLLDTNLTRCVLGYWAVSDRVLLVKLHGQPFNISIIVVYAPTSDSSDEEIEGFYEKMEEAKSQCKSNEITIIMGDINAKVGKGSDGKTVGPFGLGERNERGDRWVQWCHANDLVIINTWFKQHPRRTYTWKSPGDLTRNQIDFIVINERFKRAAKQAKTYPSADCGSDHVPVICTLQCRLKKVKKPKSTLKLDFAQLRQAEICQKYVTQVQNRFEELEDENDRTSWDAMKPILMEAAEDCIPKRENRVRNKWMTEKILSQMRDRQKIRNRECQEYKNMDRTIKQECRKAKERWLNDRCTEIEAQTNTNYDVHKKIDEISGRKVGYSSAGCIKAKDGSMLVNKDDILNRWTQYIGELYDDTRKGMPRTANVRDGPKILQSEVRSAVKGMKKNKAAGSDGVVVEMIKALEEYGLEKLTGVINKIYDEGAFPEELAKSIFIAVPKKSGAVNCEDHRTISVVIHTTKIILRILLTRLRRE